MKNTINTQTQQTLTKKSSQTKELITTLLWETDKQKIINKAQQWKNILHGYLKQEPLYKKSMHELNMYTQQKLNSCYTWYDDVHNIVVDTKKIEERCDTFNKLYITLFDSNHIKLYRILFQNRTNENFGTDKKPQEEEIKDFDEKKQNPQWYIKEIPELYLLKKKFLIWREDQHKDNKEYKENLKKWINEGEKAWKETVIQLLKPIFSQKLSLNTTKNIEEKYKKFVKDIYENWFWGTFNLTKDMFIYNETKGKIDINKNKIKEINQALKLWYKVEIERFGK